MTEKPANKDGGDFMDELELQESSPNLQADEDGDTSLSDVNLSDFSDDELSIAEDTETEEENLELSSPEEPEEEEEAKEPIQKEPAQKKPAEKPAPSSSPLDEKLATTFDHAASIGSTARHHVEAAYKGVDPADAEQRSQAREKLKASLLTFAKKALEKNALKESDVLLLFQMATSFANTLLLTRSERSS